MKGDIEKNSGLDDITIKIIFIKSFLANTNLLSLGKEIKHRYRFSSYMDELILNSKELDRIIEFGCAIEDFTKKFIFDKGEAWETLELFLEDPETHLKTLYKAGSTSFRNLIKQAVKNKENFLKHYWVTKKELIEGFYNVSDEEEKEIKNNKKEFEVFDEPDFEYEWD